MPIGVDERESHMLYGAPAANVKNFLLAKSKW